MNRRGRRPRLGAVGLVTGRMSETLNIAQVCPETSALGPGRRFVLWVQGCPFSCKGCVSPDWIPIKPAGAVPVEDLSRRITSAEGLEGVTISGGEPMLQAAGLARLLTVVRKARPHCSAIAFTGFTLERLRAMAAYNPGIASLLGQLDVLIDGLYVKELDDGRGLRGSSNQRVHFLTERYRHLRREFERGPRRVEMHLLTGDLLLVGVPSAASLKAFHDVAARSGQDGG